MPTLDIANKDVTIKECDSVPELFASGPVNVMRAGPLLTVTLTNVRADIAHLLGGGNSPDLNAVVVSRLVIPVATAEQLVRAINGVINPPTAA